MKKIFAKLSFAGLILAGTLLLPAPARAAELQPTWEQCMDRCPYSFEYCLFLCNAYS
jgi:hypothetical protein